jgi:perosamine synthetase
MFDQVAKFIKELYYYEENVPLHAPVFEGNEKKYVVDCIDSTFVSSVGAYVNKLEMMVSDYTKAKYAIATSNGTSALHMALILAGVGHDDEVLTQNVTFVATANAISYLGAHPIFLDSEKENLGLSVDSLIYFLEKYTEKKNDGLYNKVTKRKIKACVPMHVFGHPVDIINIKKICDNYGIFLIEDAAESLGSTYLNQHTGLFGHIGTLSFNGNKIVTSGGGGMILTNDENLAKRAKHLTTTAKVPHRWEFVHDEIGYNYRLPNLNAALACAQMERLGEFVENKRQTANEYEHFFSKIGIHFIKEPANSRSNYWLNAIRLKDLNERNQFLQFTNVNGVMTRPIWQLMTELVHFKDGFRVETPNALHHSNTIVNIPSSVRRVK